MDPNRYAAFLPTILEWIDRTLEAYAGQKRSVESFKFPRLPHYFSVELLKIASVVITDPLPIPPLSALGCAGGIVAASALGMARATTKRRLGSTAQAG